MAAKRKKIDPIPQEFDSDQQVGEYWDTHDTTEYPDDFIEVDVQVNLKGRRFEIQIDADVMDLLRKKARRARTDTGRLTSRLLRKELTAA